MNAERATLDRLQPQRFASPAFVVDEAALRANVAVLDDIQRCSGAKILLALKGFAMWSLFDLLSRAGQGPLYGCCASSPDEARLGREEFGGEVHAFAAGYSDDDVRTLLPLVDHLVFNSFAQWRRFRPLVEAHNRAAALAGATPGATSERHPAHLSVLSGEASGDRAFGAGGDADTHRPHDGSSPDVPPTFRPDAPRLVRCGIRVNPEHSEGATAIYNPCAPTSRLGVRPRHFVPEALDGISGLHFHTLCEQNADALERTLDAVENHFGPWLGRMDWVNFGGGHHITRADYDSERLCRCIARVRQRYDVQVYLEPGVAVALNAGYLISTVLDVVEADMPVVILDSSAAAHMPDVLEMPYRPHVLDSAQPGEKPWACRLAGKSCLAGDQIGEYAFDAPLRPGDRVVFTDMAIYSMVKTTTFNGLRLPDIYRWDSASDTVRLVRRFGYEDFRTRLS